MIELLEAAEIFKLYTAATVWGYLIGSTVFLFGLGCSACINLLRRMLP